jgi:hypothetical protein
MLRRDVNNCIDRVMELPLQDQALCVWLVAEPVVHCWVQWCALKKVPDPSNEYIDTYHRWRVGSATDDEFDAVAQRLQSALPNDLRRERDPTGGMAGWSLHAVAMIALDQCEDVHEDIFATGVAYAAAAATGNKNVTIGINWDRLTDAEVDYLNSWWRRCQVKLPQLNRTA